MSETTVIERPRRNCEPTKSKGDRKQKSMASSKNALSKKAKLESLLSRARGATLDQLQDELAWQPHTVRAAISRLRKAGHEIDLTETKGRKAYRIAG